LAESEERGVVCFTYQSSGGRRKCRRWWMPTWVSWRSSRRTRCSQASWASLPRPWSVM